PLQQKLTAPRVGRRQVIFAARQRIRIVIATADSDELVDLVIVRSHVPVAYRPWDLPSIALGAFEVEVSISQADAAPNIGLAADSPYSHQRERLFGWSEVWLLSVAEKECGRPLALLHSLAPFIGQHVGPELIPVESLPCVQHQDLDALASQVPRRHPTGSSRSDDNDIVLSRLFNYLHCTLEWWKIYALGKTGATVLDGRSWG